MLKDKGTRMFNLDHIDPLPIYKQVDTYTIILKSVCFFVSVEHLLVKAEYQWSYHRATGTQIN